MRMPPAQAVPRFRLVARVGEREVRAVLGDGGLLIGSAPDCDLVLAEPTVSRRHARVGLREGQPWIEDLGSRNGTRVRGRALSGPEPFEAGQAVRLGDVALRLEAMAPGDEALGLAAAPVHSTRDSEPVSAPEPTLVSVGLARFCLRELAPLLDRLAAGVTREAFAPHVLRALTAAEPDAGFVLSRDCEGRPLLARAGNVDLPLSARLRREDLCLDLHQPGAEPATLGTLGELGLALLCAARHGSAGGGLATPGPSPTTLPVTTSAALGEVYWQAARVSRSRLNVLIEGETGTGKELLARFLHESSGEPVERFLVLNCAALPPDLIDAELFGIEAGVATGVQARAGRFELAHGGTLFLDEIGDMAPETQARILRVLQEREVYRVGSHRARPADVRVVSATHHDLERQVSEGRFRRDLFHRIADWRARLPPLRERRGDLPELALGFLQRACANRGVRCGGLSVAALQALSTYAWPGNVRELEREMQRVALFLDDGEALTSDLLKPELREAAVASGDTSLVAQLEQVERRVIAEALAASGGQVASAAERLGLSRATLYRRLAQLGLEAAPGSR